MDSETLVQALRGAAGAKTVQCAKARHGKPECLNFLLRLFTSLKSLWNKSWVRRVPAAAVTPAALVVVTFIEPKAFVAGFVNL